MTSQYKKTDSKKKSKVFDKETISVSRPLPLKGIVNIDNISDREYEVIKKVVDVTVTKKISWKTAGLICSLKNIILKNNIVSTYKTYYEGLDIILNKFSTGKISIKASNRLTKRVVFDTFIPFKPELKLNKRVGTSRSMVLYKLFQAIRYQVEGITAT